MALKQVRSYETSDGKLFTGRGDALTHQLAVDVRGLIQSNTLGKIQTITPTDVSQFVARHAQELHILLGKYKESMRRVSEKA